MRVHVSHDLIATRIAKSDQTTEEEQRFNNSTTWKRFCETGAVYQRAYSRQPVLNKQTRQVELDRIYEDTDTETVTLQTALEQREFIKPTKNEQLQTNTAFEVHIQPESRGRTTTRQSHTRAREHAPERIQVLVSNTSCDCESQSTPDLQKAAFAVRCVFDLAQTETLGTQIWVPGRAIPGSGAGEAGVG